jgi:hypothetical protein
MNSVTGTRILGVAAFAVTLAALTAATNASADTTMKWCTTWKSTYVDAGFGEDVFTSSSPTYRAAQYTRAQVTIFNTSEEIWDGLLDSSGCTPDLPVLSNTKYRIWQWTKVERGTRKIFVIPDPPWAPKDTWPDEGAVGIYWDYTTGLLIVNQHYTVNKQLNWESPKANVMPIAGRVLGLYSTLDYPTNTKTHVRTDSETCGVSGGAWTDGSHVCLLGSGAPGWEDVTTWKYIAGHEFGHRVANANGWTAVGGYIDKNLLPNKCKCSHVTYGSQAHCLQSREYIKHGAQEGFGHLFASALYNSRVENDGKYVYCKEAFDLLGDLWVIMDPPRGWNAFQVLPESFSDRWMEKYCSNGMANRGVELDWLRFFYEMWTSGDYKFSISELLDVWADTSSPYYWNSLLDTVEDQHGSGTSKYWLFYNKGQQAGVDN